MFFDAALLVSHHPLTSIGTLSQLPCVLFRPMIPQANNNRGVAAKMPQHRQSSEREKQPKEKEDSRPRPTIRCAHLPSCLLALVSSFLPNE